MIVEGLGSRFTEATKAVPARLQRRLPGPDWSGRRDIVAWTPRQLTSEILIRFAPETPQRPPEASVECERGGLDFPVTMPTAMTAAFLLLARRRSGAKILIGSGRRVSHRLDDLKASTTIPMAIRIRTSPSRSLGGVAPFGQTETLAVALTSHPPKNFSSGIMSTLLSQFPSGPLSCPTAKEQSPLVLLAEYPRAASRRHPWPTTPSACATQ